jgi:carboxyl-terminal processing protease
MTASTHPQYRSFTLAISILLLCLSLTLASLAQVIDSRPQIQPATRLQIQKMASVLQIIDMAYVDSVDMDELVSEAIIEALKELDPHSAYIPKEEVERVNEPLEGTFEGIGVTFQIFHDTILVIAPVPGGPSDKLGIMAGDKIVKINGEDATGDKVDNQWVMDHLRGKKGTVVNVSIFRKGKKNLLEYAIIRDKIPLNSIDATFMASGDVGYIRLNRFAKSSGDEIRESIMYLRDQGMNKLILDLRGNSGGLLTSAVELSDEFLESGRLIVYTEGLHSPRQDYNAVHPGAFEQGRLVILIDEGSASASEIVSGAVQDWGRGIIVGRRSFGKGLVQKPFVLPDSSLIRLTAARYYTPTGRSIQRPYNNGTEDYYRDMQKRFEHGEFITADSIRFPDSLKYKTMNGRTVYGGGGVMPDIFLPWDSTWYSDYYADLRRKGALNQYSIDYVDAHRQDLMKRYPDKGRFIAGFDPDKGFLDGFFAQAEKDSVAYDEKGWESSGELITYQLKALVARNLFDVGAYYEVMAQIDDGYIKALEILQDENLFKKFNIR